MENDQGSSHGHARTAVAGRLAGCALSRAGRRHDRQCRNTVDPRSSRRIRCGAFGIAGRLVGRLNPQRARTAPTVGCLILAGAYAAIAVALSAGSSSEALLVPLLADGGFGLGIQFSGLLAHVTASVPSKYAADVSGVTTTTTQIGGALGVAAFGTLFLSLSHVGATHAFALVSAGFAAVAAGAAATAWRATHSVARAEVLG
jgi:hypothetical protein